METNAPFVILGIIGIAILIFLAYGLEISHLIFDVNLKKKIQSFWKQPKNFFLSLIYTKMKRIKGKIIRLKLQKFPVIIDYSLSENLNLIQNMYNLEKSAFTVGYFVFFENEKNHKKSFVEISKESFEELSEKDISSLSCISLLFEKWFWSTNYHHYELA